MVKIYTTPTCVFCEMTKEFLKEKGVPYKEYDVSKDEKAQKEMIEKSQQYGLPVIDINGKILSGFDRVKLEKEIKKQKIKSLKTKPEPKTKTLYGVRPNNRRRRTGRGGRRNLRRPKKT